MTEADLLPRSLATLLEFWDYRGRFQEGLTLFRQTIDGRVAQANPALRALLLSRAAHLEYRLDRYAEAQAHAEEVLSMQKGRDDAARAQALNVLGTCALRLGRWDDARRYFKLRLESALPEEQAHSFAVTLDHLALIEKRLGRYADALRLSLQSLKQHRRLGDTAGEALCLSNLGSLEIEMNELHAAEAHLREGLAICERDGLVSTRGLILSNLADVAFLAGDLTAAETHAQQAIEVATLIGNRLLAAATHGRRASIALRRGNLAVARAALVESLARAIELPSPPMMLDSVLQFAELLEAQGEVAGARAVLAIAAAHPATTQQVRTAIRAMQARLPEAAGDPGVKSLLGFDDLVIRVVAEAGLGHAPLIDTLRAASRTVTPA